MNKLPPLFKSCTAYINRADELDKNDTNPDNKIMSFYCRMWALTKGFEIKQAQPILEEADKKELDNYLKNLMLELEKRKPTLGVTKDQAASKCEIYAYNLYNEADIEDQTGAPTQFTATKYYNAKTYFDILEQFGPLNDDIKDKAKTAALRALQINKAVKAGQIPPALNPSSSSSFNQEISSAPPAPPQMINIQQEHSIPPQNISNQYAPTPVSYSHTPVSNFSPISQVTQALSSIMPIASSSSSETKYKDCTELCHFAIAALKHNDANLAKERLQEALRLLG